MKIEDRTKEKKMFGSLKVGDVFKYLDNLYVKTDPIYPIKPNSNMNMEVIKDSIEFCRPVNAYNLTSHEFNYTFDNYTMVQPVKATLVIE